MNFQIKKHTAGANRNFFYGGYMLVCNNRKMANIEPI
jgi:hypothetical protein